MEEKNVVMVYSCGKDSTLALYRIIKEGYKVSCLMITVREEGSWFHGVPKELMKEVEESLKIPIIYCECSMENYEEDFVKGLNIAKKEYGVSLCAFGDIDLEEHRNWDLAMCKRAGLKGVLPLWQESREKITMEFIDLGFKGVIKKVNLNNMGFEFLGKVLSKEVIREIEKTGSDICGENGEYHTFVFDGPIFNKKIKYKVVEKNKNNNYGNLIL
ncbi:MAG: diphthine--ammonia ligase [Clostridium sp.]